MRLAFPFLFAVGACAGGAPRPPTNDVETVDASAPAAFVQQPVAALPSRAPPPLTVAAMVGGQKPPGTYLVDGYVVQAPGYFCPPCNNPHVNCTPCPPPRMLLADDPSAKKGPSLALADGYVGHPYRGNKAMPQTPYHAVVVWDGGPETARARLLTGFGFGHVGEPCGKTCVAVGTAIAWGTRGSAFRRVASCGGPDIVPLLDRVVGNPDVLAALGAAALRPLEHARDENVLGLDTRPAGGSLFMLDVGGLSVLVGPDCGDAQACTPVASGVRAAVVALENAPTPTPECE